LLARQRHEVAGTLATQQRGVAEGAAQQRDVALQGVDGRRRRVTAPDVFDQSVDGDDLAGHERQAGEHRSLPRAPERDRFATPFRPDRAEQMYVETPETRGLSTLRPDGHIVTVRDGPTRHVGGRSDCDRSDVWRA
jgi:hypothetical protein